MSCYLEYYKSTTTWYQQFQSLGVNRRENICFYDVVLNWIHSIIETTDGKYKGNDDGAGNG